MFNFFLLFHKCGNRYVRSVHRRHTSIPYHSVTSKNIDWDELQKAGPIVNVRCRNFGTRHVNHAGLLQLPDCRLLFFTRHPASFVLSATKYHLRGGERWALCNPQKHLDGLPLTTALRQAATDDDRQIITMRHFRYIYERQSSLMSFLHDERFKRVRCEDLFTTTDDAYFAELAAHLRLAGDFREALKKAAPSFQATLPKHATGEFRKNSPYSHLGKQAQSYYDEHYREYETMLDY